MAAPRRSSRLKQTMATLTSEDELTWRPRMSKVNRVIFNCLIALRNGEQMSVCMIMGVSTAWTSANMKISHAIYLFGPKCIAKLQPAMCFLKNICNFNSALHRAMWVLHTILQVVKSWIYAVSHKKVFINRIMPAIRWNEIQSYLKKWIYDIMAKW